LGPDWATLGVKDTVFQLPIGLLPAILLRSLFRLGSYSTTRGVLEPNKYAMRERVSLCCGSPVCLSKQLYTCTSAVGHAHPGRTNLLDSFSFIARRRESESDIL